MLTPLLCITGETDKSKMNTATKPVSEAARAAEQIRSVSSPVMYQRWRELLFLHWSIKPERIAKDLPSGLHVDTFGGRAWLGVVPFRMEGVRPRFLPPLKGLSNFPELNLRTYVYDAEGRPGVWFYSLDTPMRLPNWIARTFFHLNYRLARMRLDTNADRINYQSELWKEGAWDVSQEYGWSRRGETFLAEPGSLEFFLVERYRLFAYYARKQKILTGRVHHKPYPLQQAELEAYSTRLFALSGFEEPVASPESVLASPGVDVEIFPMESERSLYPRQHHKAEQPTSRFLLR